MGFSGGISRVVGYISRESGVYRGIYAGGMVFTGDICRWSEV